MLVDAFNRQINYLRISVTDRCNFRCVYCMAEKMTFLPRARLLTLEEIYEVARVFTELGVKKIRITGGEPLVRRNIISLFHKISSLPTLDELTLTTNGSRLSQYAKDLHAAGIKRINVSLDTLNANKFLTITRTGKLQQVIDGILEAKSIIGQVKINAVIMRGHNDDEIIDLVKFSIENDVDISFIEEMPLGEITDRSRSKSYYLSDEVRANIEKHYQLLPSSDSTGGPSRYFRLTEHPAIKIGFISPHSQNFCERCNRVRITAEGKLLLCLGHENSIDLRAVIRNYPGDTERLRSTIINAMNKKPERHYFKLNDDVHILRFMNMTGG